MNTDYELLLKEKLSDESLELVSTLLQATIDKGILSKENIIGAAREALSTFEYNIDKIDHALKEKS